MTQQERDTLGRTLTEIAIYFGKDFPKEQAVLYINTLLKLVPASLYDYLQGLDRYTKNGGKTFPTPFMLKPYIENKPNAEQLSHEIASRIRYAISEIGWSSPTKAKEFIGTVGWKIVERSGGWQYLCENHGVKLQPLTYFAQCRDLAKNIIELDEKEIDSEKYLLNDNKNVLQLANIKQIKGVTNDGSGNS